MNMSSDVSEQLVRMYLEGFEITAKITGAAVERVVAALYAIAKNKVQNYKTNDFQTKLKQGGKKEIITVKDEDIEKFKKGAKMYGLKDYCSVRDKKIKDGMNDFYIDPAKANIVEQIAKRFEIAVLKTTMETEVKQIDKDKENVPVVSEQEADDLAFQLLGGGMEEEQTEPEGENPILARTDALNPSENISATSRSSTEKLSAHKELESAREEIKNRETKKQDSKSKSERKQPNKKKQRSK